MIHNEYAFVRMSQNGEVNFTHLCFKIHTSMFFHVLQHFSGTYLHVNIAFYPIYKFLSVCTENSVLIIKRQQGKIFISSYIYKNYLNNFKNFDVT